MDSGDFDSTTSGGRLRYFAPKHEMYVRLCTRAEDAVEVKDRTVRGWEWAAIIGLKKDTFYKILNSESGVSRQFIDRVDEWLLQQGRTDSDLRWWKLGGDFPTPPTGGTSPESPAGEARSEQGQKKTKKTRRRSGPRSEMTLRPS